MESPLHTIALIDDPDLLGPPADHIPPRDEFIGIVGADLDGKAAGLLRILLAKLRTEADVPLAERLVMIEQLGRFVVAGPSILHTNDRHPTLARLELLVRALERIPAAQRRFEQTVRSTFGEMRAIKLFGEIGLPNDRGLLAETTDRLARRFLPEPPNNAEMWILASRIVRSVDDLAWLGPAADPLLQRLAVAGGKAWEPLRSAILDAIGLITTRIAAQGISEALRSRARHEDEHGVLRGGGVRDSPLYRLTRAQPAEMPALIDASRRHLDLVRIALEEKGVSIDVVYAIDSIERGLSRIELLLPFVGGPSSGTADERAPYEIRAVIAAVGHALVGGRSFLQLMSDNLRLLARKVIERAGRTGEHYVTSTRREYWRMMSTAAGGGVLTLGTAILKFFVKWGSFPLFIDGALSSVVYAGSFVVMQLLGFTLATKQPSMTAAALAGTIRDRAGPGMLDELVKLIARIARSQFAAALGNVSAAIVTTLAFDFIYTRVTGSPFLGAEAAAGIVKSFDPIGSWTVPFAALTGVILWVSSLFAGWFENWVVYRRLPEAIEHHRWGKRLGKKRMARLARFLEREAAGFGGSVSLGTILGMTPVVSKFFGLGLDVRHVTLSTVSLTLAMSSVGIDGVGWQAFLLASWGIAIIGLLNFGVSFALALVVALRARDVPRGERRTLPGAVFRKFLRRPFVFFYPPKDEPGAADHHGNGAH
ncbi:MAG: gliding motility protein [Deltaproteobacteria bacterium]|nr:gliding motility protein [Deltaproteobacteria bacterium]